jgi:hypothetical protein
MKLYEIANGYVFAVCRDGRVDAWGERVVAGTLFDTVDGAVQTNAFLTGPSFMDDDTLIRCAVDAMFDTRVVRCMTMA